MPDTPFPVQGNDVNETLRRMQQIIEDMYEERIGGASLGDVFEVGDDDVLALRLADEGGLEKSDNELQVKASTTGGIAVDENGVAVDPKTNGGITVDADGVSVKVKTDGGLALDANGLYVTNPLVIQTHEADAETAHSTADFAGVNTALNALGTKINNILKKLEDANILGT